ncbi:MAG: hypothetical protein LBJ33_15730 [Pseudomonas putida]|nr:hypothetical protein [Pseudomonas putida]
MALSDGGIPRLAGLIVKPHLAAGRLVPLFEPGEAGQTYAQTEPMDICLCLADRFAMTPKMRAFMAYLQKALGDAWTVQA